jgi:GAF domain-containing protein
MPRNGLLLRPAWDFSGRVVQPQSILDSRCSCRYNFPRAAEAAEGGLHGAFAFPIILGGEVTGVMEFFSRGIHAPDDDLLSMLTALGTQIGKFIERDRMAEQLALYTENC